MYVFDKYYLGKCYSFKSLVYICTSPIISFYFSDQFARILRYYDLYLLVANIDQMRFRRIITTYNISLISLRRFKWCK